MSGSKWIAAGILFILFSLLFHFTDHEYHLSSKWYLNRCLKDKNLEEVRDQGRRMLSEIRESGLIDDNGHYSISDVSQSTLVPPSIKELSPKSIHVMPENILIIRLPVPRRVNLLVYQEGTPESGTSLLVDGLWYWNASRPLR
ncbi:hypothetical protein BVX97_06390 [bacterium E08(2017)]|nr:hypothetical protein BVX97_06390 [bacterium E08(2017)]